MSQTQTYIIKQEQQLKDFAYSLAPYLPEKGHIHLIGNLGAGKTTLTRYLLQALGHKGAVKSPTFTLVETYQLDQYRIYHFDLYRISDPQELYFIGIEDYLSDTALSIIEWADKALGLLPNPELTIELAINAHDYRELKLIARSQQGYAILSHL